MGDITVAATAGGAVRAPEELAVRQVSQDYVDSWYAGDAGRMERILHPEVAKRFLRSFPSGTEFLEEIGASKLIAWTASGGGRSIPNEQRRNAVVVLDCYFRTAMSKVVTAAGVEYLQLGKFAAEWRVVNILGAPQVGGPGALPLASPPTRVERRDDQRLGPAVEAAARDYAEGWYLADGARIATMTHPQWSKKAVRLSRSGRFFLEPWGAEKMARWTASQEHRAERGDRGLERVDVVTLDQHGHLAAVKIVWDFDARVERAGSVDYLSCALIDDRWLAINLMWQEDRSEGEDLLDAAETGGWIL